MCSCVCVCVCVCACVYRIANGEARDGHGGPADILHLSPLRETLSLSGVD